MVKNKVFYNPDMLCNFINKLPNKENDVVGITTAPDMSHILYFKVEEYQREGVSSLMGMEFKNGDMVSASPSKEEWYNYITFILQDGEWIAAAKEHAHKKISEFNWFVIYKYVGPNG